MERYYFTFGSWEGFPYQNTYLAVASSGYEDAVRAFREKHPDVTPGCMNCSDCYGEEQWETVRSYYAGREPAEIILTATCFGQKPDGYGDLFLYVPGMRQIIRVSEGSGDNLMPEDIAEGYADYIYYDQHELSSGMPEAGGGQVLLKEQLRDKYGCMADCIRDVLEMAYGSCLVDCMIL